MNKHERHKQLVTMIDELLAFIEEPEVTQVRLAFEADNYTRIYS